MPWHSERERELPEGNVLAMDWPNVAQHKSQKRHRKTLTFDVLFIFDLEEEVHFLSIFAFLPSPFPSSSPNPENDLISVGGIAPN